MRSGFSVPAFRDFCSGVPGFLFHRSGVPGYLFQRSSVPCFLFQRFTFSVPAYPGISDHSLIYAIRKINAKPITESQGYVEFRNFKKFKVSNFLNDLYGVPWEEIRNKSDVDGMWEIWKTLFVDVLNKHAPIQSKRIRKRGNIPWLNSEVKAILFKRDNLKKRQYKLIMNMTGNYTDYLGTMLIVHCALLKRIIMLINSQIIIETLKLHGKQ